jgi:hypothetical protein
MAISTPDLINDPYLLRVPPASIKSLGEYGKMLAKRGVGYNMVVTKIGFDMESPTPKLTFKATGLLSDTAYGQVQAVIASETVQAILGSEGIAAAQAEETADLPVVDLPTLVPVVEKPAVKAKAGHKVPTPAPVVEPEIAATDLNLDDLNFDD